MGVTDGVECIKLILMVMLKDKMSKVSDLIVLIAMAKLQGFSRPTYAKGFDNRSTFEKYN